MITLSSLENTSRPTQKIQRVGRGNGSGRGKTCCRGHKGDKARSGYKRRYGHEGGQLPLYRKVPCRGFTNGRFKSSIFTLNLRDIERMFQDGDKVNMEVLLERGIATPKFVGGLKILSCGELTKKVEIQARYISEEAKAKLEKSGISFSMLPA